MTIFEGTYKLESSDGLAAGFAAMGIPDDDTKNYLKSEVIYTLHEKSPGCFEYKNTCSLLPSWNMSNCVKLGEEKELTEPFPMKICYSKKNSNTFSSRTEMLGKTLISEMVFHNYGVSISNKIDGTNISFTELFKRITPKINGYFMFESESGLAEVFKAMGHEVDDVAAIMKDAAYRQVETADGSGMEITEYFGGAKKCYSFKYNQEFDFDRPEWNISDKCLVTKVGPGIFKRVNKHKVTGRVTEQTMTVGERAITIKVKVEGVEATETLKRGCDIEGTWRPASVTGLEAHAEALGMTGAMKEQYIQNAMNETFTVERLVGGAMKITSDSAWLPGGVMVVRSGEQFTLEMPGLGVTTGLGYEGCDEWIQTSKMMGKTVSNKERITGDFMINEAIVDGCENTKQVTILTRN